MTDDEPEVCPRCGGEVEWVRLFEDRDELFAACTRCTWGED